MSIHCSILSQEMSSPVNPDRFIIEALGLATLADRVPPLLRKAGGAHANFIPGKTHQVIPPDTCKAPWFFRTAGA